MAMNQEKPKSLVGQFEYMGRWVDKAHFSAFVYNTTGKKLAKNYEEFEKLISSGIWFVSRKDLEEKMLNSNSGSTEKEEIEAYKNAKLNKHRR